MAKLKSHATRKRSRRTHALRIGLFPRRKAILQTTAVRIRHAAANMPVTIMVRILALPARSVRTVVMSVIMYSSFGVGVSISRWHWC
jgi:hypothetical protein